MRFVIDNTYLELNDYKQLEKYVDVFPVCSSILSFLDKWFDESLDSIEFQTSGSTGSPKNIKHLKSSMVVSAQITQKAFDYKSGDTTLLSLPVQYISGCMMLVRSIVANLDLYISDLSTNPLNKINSVTMDKIGFAPMTPMQFEYLYTNNIESLSKFDTILLGGAQVSALQHKYIRSVEPDVYIGYGMTETITHLALKKLNHNPDQNYHVLEGFNIAQNSDDCLVVSANHLSEKIITTDIVDLISNTEFAWKGRADNIINSGGLKINPFELEITISKHLNLPFFITSVPDNQLGERVLIVIERDSFSTIQKQSEFIYYLKDVFEKLTLGNKRPRLLYVVKSFKLTTTGKVDKVGICAEIGDPISNDEVVLI